MKYIWTESLLGPCVLGILDDPSEPLEQAAQLRFPSLRSALFCLTFLEAFIWVCRWPSPWTLEKVCSMRVRLGSPVWKFQLSLIRPSGPGPSFLVTETALEVRRGAIHRNPPGRLPELRMEARGPRKNFLGAIIGSPTPEWARLGWCHYIQKPLHTVQWAAFRTEMTLSMSRGQQHSWGQLGGSVVRTQFSKRITAYRREIAPLAIP